VSSQEIARAMSATQAEVAKVVDEAQKADESTQKLTVAAESMSNIIQMIQDIAGQINLLALNATIESARAGGVRCRVIFLRKRGVDAKSTSPVFLNFRPFSLPE